ncbi:MAG: diacylglycerol kinase family protein [Candidatus Nealsonbacteria bacterium]|nr:diacylglycerol kinase family protein [Candidatus Nealsonbacteria bacterium]
MKNQKFLKRLKTASLGIITALKEEKSFRIQFLIGLVVIFLMIVLGLNYIEKTILILIILVVLSLELINSQVEKFLDLINPDHHPTVKRIKDLTAAAVLLSVVGSIAMGILIFLPYIINLIKR